MPLFIRANVKASIDESILDEVIGVKRSIKLLLLIVRKRSTEKNTRAPSTRIMRRTKWRRGRVTIIGSNAFRNWVCI